MSPPPRAWASASYLSPRVSGPLRVQRRVLRGYGQRRARIGHLASAPGTWWSWRRAGAGEALDALDPDQVARFCTTTGIEAPEVRRRLTALARHGVPPPLALRLGLPREGYVERWAEYVSDRHLGWNLAAGGRRSRPGLLTLGDKARTASLLRDAGIPVVESVLLRAGEPAGDRVRAFLDQHGEAFLKPNTGSRGRDAHRLADARVVAHQQVEPVGDLEPWLAGLRPAEALLLQPRLVSHPDFAPVADAHDVV
ncbi:MAG: hypothetical protein JWO76_387, partial [Nocardioides sp.]|nr:hypothetical protein [Nocardioides sp.]